MNFRIITKNRAADLEKGFLTKPILKPYGRATTMPTAWELIQIINCDESHYFLPFPTWTVIIAQFCLKVTSNLLLLIILIIYARDFTLLFRFDKIISRLVQK